MVRVYGRTVSCAVRVAEVGAPCYKTLLYGLLGPTCIQLSRGLYRITYYMDFGTTYCLSLTTVCFLGSTIGNVSVHRSLSAMPCSAIKTLGESREGGGGWA